MWKSLSKPLPPILSFLSSEALLIQQIRTVYIFKRRYPVPLHKKGENPKPLKPKHYVYDLIEDTSVRKQPSIDVVLTSFVDGLGNPGEKVTVPQNYGYINLLLPKLAVYATPENLEKYKDAASKTDVIKYSSAQANTIAQMLRKTNLSVIMNKENPWTLKPWHIRVAFRRCGIIVPEDAIEMPPKEIKGPDMNIQDKEFYVTVTINNTEKVKVRCRIHHWSTQMSERIPHIHEFWKKPTESIHPEFAAVLAELPSAVVEEPLKEEDFN